MPQGAFGSYWVQKSSHWGSNQRGRQLGGPFCPPRLDWHFIEDEKPPPMVLRGHEVHKRVKMPQRACRVCRRNRGAMKGKLTARRIPLDPNALPRVSRSTSGCQGCGVNLCVRGSYWEVWHRSPRGLQGASERCRLLVEISAGVNGGKKTAVVLRGIDRLQFFQIKK